MYLWSCILLVSSSSLAVAHQTFDVGISYYAKLNSLLESSTCKSDNGSAIVATPAHAYKTGHNYEYFGADRGLWTTTPYCVQKSNDSLALCVFTDSKFAHGRGISILTDPATAQEISQLPAFTDSQVLAGINEPADSPSFEIRELPGRGMGVIANRTIEQGDLIMAYTTTTIFHGEAFDDLDYHMLHMVVEQLPKPSRARWMDSAAHFDGDFYNERINTNAFSEEFEDEEHFVIIPEVARLNHDCRPNAVYYFDTKKLSQNVHASRTIYAGEEITISYIDPLQTRKKRRAATKRSWGFKCTCSLCTQSTSLTRASDDRIKLILKLTELLENWESSRKATPEMGDLLVSLYEQERLYASIADAYRLAALAYNAVGNEWMAVKYAMKALEVGVIDLGPQDADVRDIKELTKAPMKHWSWMKRIAHVFDEL